MCGGCQHHLWFVPQKAVPESSAWLGQRDGLFLSDAEHDLPTNLLLLLLVAVYVPNTLLAFLALKWRADARS